MSFYCYVEGYIEYSNQKTFEQALAYLQKGGWLNKHYRWVPDDEEDTRDVIDFKNCTIIIPYNNFRSFSKALDDIMVNVKSCKLLCASTDGCFEGWIYFTSPEQNKQLEGLQLNLNIAKKVHQLSFSLNVFAVDLGMTQVKLNEDNLKEYVAYEDDVIRVFYEYFSDDQTLLEEFNKYKKKEGRHE